jgi:gas vesicle protein
MAVWPLIDHVNIYVKADILKGGLVLVDLPGLSDIVESRAAVARKYYQNLAVTAIVTPWVRAADERTAVSLMTENQELSMRMDGKFDGRSFGVVLSKADDIDPVIIAKNMGWDERLQAIKQLNHELKKSSKLKEDWKKQEKQLQKATKQAKDKAEKDELQKKLKHLRKLVRKDKKTAGRKEKAVPRSVRQPISRRHTDSQQNPQGAYS